MTEHEEDQVITQLGLRTMECGGIHLITFPAFESHRIGIQIRKLLERFPNLEEVPPRKWGSGIHAGFCTVQVRVRP